ncbi:hypothetical protein RQP46_007404 [Phenoliferia psychrophenolica]
MDHSPSSGGSPRLLRPQRRRTGCSPGEQALCKEGCLLLLRRGLALRFCRAIVQVRIFRRAIVLIQGLQLPGSLVLVVVLGHQVFRCRHKEVELYCSSILVLDQVKRGGPLVVVESFELCHVFVCH